MALSSLEADTSMSRDPESKTPRIRINPFRLRTLPQLFSIARSRKITGVETFLCRGPWRGSKYLPVLSFKTKKGA
jgi:hypothetical protein